MSSSRSRTSTSSRTSQLQLKKFTFKQIQEKVAERWEIPEYYDILMEAAVKEEADGIQFNLKHASFQKLIKLVKEHDANKKNKKHKTKKDKNKSKNKTTTNTSNTHNKMNKMNKSRKIKVLNRSGKSRKKVKSQQEWLDILTEQLSSHSPSAKTVREACKHVGIPINLRATIWKILLNVPKKKAKLFQRQNKDYYSPHNKFKTKKINREHYSDNSSDNTQEHSQHSQHTQADTSHTTHTNTSFEPLRDDPPPLYNQRVIQADIERTRPTMKCFQDSAIRHEMEIILTEYCHRNKVSYKQGMNYVLAPFFMIEMKDRLDIYLCFESFIETYLNSTFNDEEFGSLQCIFRMFRLLIQYHDPLLSTFLDHHEIMPELFASGWFMTIHANKCDKMTLLHLWDQILLSYDTCFHYFIDVEILRHNKSDILKKSQEELPQFLVNLIIEDRDYARRLLKEAYKTSMNTPSSFHEMLQKCSQKQIIVDSIDYINLEKLPCLSIQPKELIGHCYAEQLIYNLNNNIDPFAHSNHGHANANINGSGSGFKFAKAPPPAPAPVPNMENVGMDTTKKYGRKVRKLLKQSTKYAEQNKNQKFFILDCRPLEQYSSGHLPTAFWIDPSLEVSSEQLRDKLNSLLSMKGCHFVLFFDGRHSSSDQLLLNNNDPLSIISSERDNNYNMDPFVINNDVEEEVVCENEQQLFRQSLLYFFLEKRIKYISICESGYAGCHELIVGNLELIDHESATCIECNGKWKNSLLSSVKGRFNNLISVAGGSMEKLRNKMHIHKSDKREKEREHNEHNQHNEHNENENGFILTNNYSNTSDVFEFKEHSHIHLCANSPLLMIYLSILRDKETRNVDKFIDITHKLLVLIFGEIFSFIWKEIEWKEISCQSPLDISYGSLMCGRGIYGVCLNDECQNALQNLLDSFQPIMRSVIGTLKVEESFIQDNDGIIRSNKQCIALMPKDIDNRIIILFNHTITENIMDVCHALLKLGAKQENIIIISIISSRQSLISLNEKFKKLHVWTACIDAVNSHNSNKLIPGIGVFQHRYKLKKNKTKKTQKIKRKKKKKVAEIIDTNHNEDDIASIIKDGNDNGNDNDNQHNVKDQSHIAPNEIIQNNQD